MALIECWECKAQVSDTAATCPHCGAARKATVVRVEEQPKKAVWPWVLGVPAALFALFLLYGASIPDYKAQAMERRRICEMLAAPYQRDECDRNYERDVAAGKRAAEANSRP